MTHRDLKMLYNVDQDHEILAFMGRTMQQEQLSSSSMQPSTIELLFTRA